MDRRIFFLRTQMLSNLRHQSTLEEMANSINVSASHLQKLFRAETGMSPAQYLRNLRLDKARELLETTFKRVKEISFEVGIKDQSHFVKDFKQKFGLTPSDYCKQCQEKIEVAELYAKNGGICQ